MGKYAGGKAPESRYLRADSLRIQEENRKETAVECFPVLSVGE